VRLDVALAGRQFHFEAGPAGRPAATQAPPPGPAPEGRLEFTPLELELVAKVKAAAGRYVTAEALADECCASLAMVKGVLPNLCERSRGRMASVQGKGCRWLGEGA
jgi:hypothetical protein